MAAGAGVQHNDTATYRAGIEQALASARRRLRWQRSARGLAATFFVPALLGAAWIGISRFTLLEPPRWPVFVGPAVWLLVLLAWAVLHRPGRAASARYLD